MSSARSVACAARSLACCSRSAARSATRSLASRSRTHPGMPRHRSRRSGVSLALTLTLEGLPLALTLCCSRAGTRPHWLTSHAPRAARRAPRRTYKEAAVAAPRRRAGKRRVPSCSAGWPGGTRALGSEAALARARATRGGRGWPSERSQECDCSSCPRDAPVPFSPSNSPRKTPKPAGGRVRPSVP